MQSGIIGLILNLLFKGSGNQGQGMSNYGFWPDYKPNNSFWQTNNPAIQQGNPWGASLIGGQNYSQFTPQTPTLLDYLSQGRSQD